MPQSEHPTSSRLTIVHRDGCHLCEEMIEAVRRLGEAIRLPPVEIVDVDSDLQLQRRYGVSVPVLLLDGSPVCKFVLDEPELRRLLRAGG